MIYKTQQRIQNIEQHETHKYRELACPGRVDGSCSTRSRVTLKDVIQKFEWNNATTIVHPNSTETIK